MSNLLYWCLCTNGACSYIFFYFFYFFTIGASGALPIKLVKFEAKLVEGVVDINWTTAAEKDNDFFSADGIAFQKGAFFNAISSGARFDICYTIEENFYRNTTSLQLNVRDIKLN